MIHDLKKFQFVMFLMMISFFVLVFDWLIMNFDVDDSVYCNR